MSNLVLWGHHVKDYQEMFDLSEENLKGRLLEFASGTSAFNAEITQDGGECISVDPLYALDKSTLKSKAGLIFAGMMDELLPIKQTFDFSRYGGLDAFIKQRKKGMEIFFADYTQGKKEQRYQAVQKLPLAFDDFYFDYALSSHYLFADLENQSVELYVTLIKELARVAKEVRIFPLINQDGQLSPNLGPVLLALQTANYGVEVRSTPYHLQKQGNAFLRVWAQECEVK